MPHLNIVHPQLNPFIMRFLIVTDDFSTGKDVFRATSDVVFAYLRDWIEFYAVILQPYNDREH